MCVPMNFSCHLKMQTLCPYMQSKGELSVTSVRSEQVMPSWRQRILKMSKEWGRGGNRTLGSCLKLEPSLGKCLCLSLLLGLATNSGSHL